ncbi:MAG: DUF2249 domain-containing protein [Gemmatimonadales bacterium]
MSDAHGDPLPEFDPACIVDLDVRDDMARGVAPLPRILDTTRSLAAEQVLHVRSPFRPERLFDRLARDGFHWHTEGFSDGDWSTWFWREAATLPRVMTTSSAASEVSAGVMDLRLLPPPEPMLRVLERVEADPGPFDVLVPFFPEPLARILEPSGRRVVLIERRADGVRVRIEPAS